MESRQAERGVNQVREQLLEAWRFVLKRRDIDIDDEWAAVEGTSLDALDVAWRVEEIFGGKFPLSLFAEEPTVRRQADWLVAHAEGKPWSPIVRLRQGTGKRPFFCVHPIDGNVLCYTDIAAAMKEDLPFFGIQAKGLDGVEQPIRTLPAMAKHYVEAIRTVQRKGPYHVGGWSVGGTIAFLVAQQLRARGEEVALLAMIDALYPERSAAGRDPSPDEWREFERLILDSPEPVPEEYLEGRTLHELNLEQWVQYRPQPYDGKITMIVADQQLRRMQDALADLRREMKKGPFGKARRALRTAERLERMSPLRWREVAGGGFEMVPLAGGHGGVIRGDSAASIARLLSERMR